MVELGVGAHRLPPPHGDEDADLGEAVCEELWGLRGRAHEVKITVLHRAVGFQRGNVKVSCKPSCCNLDITITDRYVILESSASLSLSPPPFARIRLI